MKKTLIMLLILCFAFSFACGGGNSSDDSNENAGETNNNTRERSQTTETPETPETPDPIIAVADAALDNILEAYATDDYAKYLRDCDEIFTETLTEELFLQSQELMKSSVGAYTSRELESIEHAEGNIIVTYTAEFENESDVTIVIVFKEGDAANKVAGLWFRSPKLEEAALAQYEIAGEEREEVITAADPIIESILAGYNEGDYKQYSADFDSVMLEALPEDVFAQTREMIIEKIGTYSSKELTNVLDADGSYAVIYTGVFEKEAEVIIKLILTQVEDGYKVSGLWFDSEKLREQ